MSSGGDSIGGTLRRDMIELASHLRQERLFVNAEQQNLQILNEKVLHVSSDLAQQAWITARQRGNLNNLIVARAECTPARCCRRANAIENSRFVDGYKRLRYRTCLAYGEFFSALRKSPKLVASCLVEAERTNPDEIQDVVQCLAAGLYGSCLLPDDKILVLKLLRHLMYLQVIPSDNPRRLLRHGTCAFSRFYSVFHENLFSAKLFLTAALHEPITQLLMEDETYLDIDPDKVSIRFSPSERSKKFGKEGTPEYQTKLQRYRLWTVNCLFRIAQRFIVGIRENAHCFPTSVRWLVKQMAALLTKNDNVDAKEVHGICTDLVFTYFICPAIVNPEPYGITDAPVSQIARLNLMQVGQILQMLSLIKYQPVDPKTMDLYKKFDKDSVSSLLDSMLEGGATDDLEDETSVLESNNLDGLDRSTALFTENELNSLVTFLRDIDHDLTGREDPGTTNFDDRKLLNDLLSRLPPAETLNENSTPGKRAKAGAEDGNDEPGVCSLEDDSTGDKDEAQDVLVIPFSPGIGESVGTLSEKKILRLGLESELENGSNVTENEVDRIEKRTRFSLSHDEVPLEGSIGGNASDNLEAVSEAASNHSVASSLELEAEDQHDNLSDMVSANVSGRGSPNISGRDTPSSQLTEGDEGRGVGELRQLDLPPPNIPGKQSRSEIDDKFYKFEIKKLIEGDETVSMVSDTWSTDVLASDSETVEQHDRPLPTSCYPGPQSLMLPVQTVPLDTSETASEAWSTDVLASDSERMTEVDTDDTASVARSDDTTRSEIENESRGDAELESPATCFEDHHSSATIRRAGQYGPMPPVSPNVTDYHNHHHASGGAEFVDKNANSISNLEYGKTLSSSRQTVASSKIESLEDPSNEIVIGLSTTSLASSSSSGSDSRSKNESRNHNNNDENQEGGSSVLSARSINATSTGTIPKSISFDMTAERGDKELLDEDQKNKRGFFGKLKMSLKNRRGKAIRCNEELNRYYEGEDVGRPRLRRILSEDVSSSSHAGGSIDEILAKYRRKTSMNSESVPIESNQTKSKETEDERLFIDPNNVETCFAFSDAKRKLRMVLSEADLQQIPCCANGCPERGEPSSSQRENDLVAFLQLQLAEAINLQDRGSMAHLHETLRCVRLFNEDGCVKLVESLRKDYQKRSTYVAYLIRCRQGLLSTLAHLNRLGVRIRGDRDAVNNHLVSVCVRVFLEKKENLLCCFCEEFKTLRLSDEKQEFVDNFLRKVYTEMDNDAIWQCASKKQLELAETVVERIVMARVYHYALYPNTDGDIYRDQLLHDHIKKLSKVVGPNHKDLRIQKIYHYECPWPWAQAELAVVSAYKTPKDKLRCVFRCATTIMSLLSMASERTVPAADDLVPVLVYVIIKTNPPSLLSTVQYVDSFYGNRLEGEEQYWWTQFCSAIEFIKTMD